MQNIHLEFVAPNVARFKRAKKYAQELCGITKHDMRDMDIKDIHDLLTSCNLVSARLRAAILVKAKQGLTNIGLKT